MFSTGSTGCEESRLTLGGTSFRLVRHWWSRGGPSIPPCRWRPEPWRSSSTAHVRMPPRGLSTEQTSGQSWDWRRHRTSAFAPSSTSMTSFPEDTSSARMLSPRTTRGTRQRISRSGRMRARVPNWALEPRERGSQSIVCSACHFTAPAAHSRALFPSVSSRLFLAGRSIPPETPRRLACALSTTVVAAGALPATCVDRTSRRPLAQATIGSGLNFVCRAMNWDADNARSPSTRSTPPAVGSGAGSRS